MLQVLDAHFAYAHRQGLEISRPEGTPFYVFVRYRSPAQVHLAGKWEDARDRCILFAPGTPQWYRSAGKNYVNDWAHFTDGDGFMQALGLPLDALISTGSTLCFARAFQNLCQNPYPGAPRQAHRQDAELRGLLYRLADENSRPAHEEVPSRYAETLAEARGRLYSRPGVSTSVASLAKRAGLSVSYFQALYKKQYGVAVGEDIIRGRLDRACYLLRSSGYTVAQVAAMSGYSCDAHFSRQFRKWMGSTPGQYRGSG